ncbi:MAG: MEDS domain-containing protein, partial [Acidobacteriia bacterium]|nr:MEDS domain-containing protein [Terriglobia bacterium]
MRHTGIPSIGDVPWGTHFCQFYQDEQDLIEILVPYFKAGLEDGEFCMWITSAPLRAEEARKALATEIPDLEDYLRRGQIEILDYGQWYKPGGRFEAGPVLEGWVAKLDAARKQGWEGLRLSGNTFWLETSDWASFTEYEAMVDGIIGKYPMLALCTYSLTKCGAAEIMDVVANHAFALIQRGGRWQIIESAERKKIQASLHRSEERLRKVNAELKERIAHSEREGRKLQQLNRTLRALSKADQALLLAPEEEAYLQEVCRIIVEDCGHAMVWVGYAENDEAKTVRPMAWSGFEEGYLETLRITWADTERGQGPTGAAIRSGKPCTCRHMLTDPQFLPWRAEAVRRGYASSLALPLADGDHVFGALTVYSREPDPFSADEVKLLGELAADFAHGIAVLRLRAAHQQAAEDLRQQREWLRVTLTSIGDAVLATDTAGRISFLNPVAERLTEWPEGEALGRPIQEVFRIIDEGTHREGGDIVGRVLREGRIVTLSNGTALVTRAGREIPIEDSAAPIRDAAGAVSGVVLVFHDVTEKRRDQFALRQSEQRVKLKLQSILSPEGDIGKLELGDVIDAEAIQSFMEDFYRLAGLPMAIVDLKGKVLVGVGWQDICTRFHRVHPETCRNCIESDTQLSAGVAPGEFKLYQCENHMWDVATPLMVGGKHVGNIFTGQFFFEDEPVDREVFRSQARQYGFDEAAYLAALDKAPRITRQAVVDGMAFLAKMGQMLSLLSYSNIKLARSVAELERAKSGLLRQAALIDLSPDGIIVRRLDGTIGFWSRGAENLYGWTREEAIGRRTHELLRTEFPKPLEQILEGIRETGRWSGELIHHARDGRRLVVQSRWLAQHGSQDELTELLESNVDVTEAHQAEEQLRQAQKLESIGLLAGGIAHDFNNLLVGVVGNASLAEDMLPYGSPAVEILQRIMKAGEQAAHLTRQMLAYAGKGRFIVEPVNLSTLVRDASVLIQSSVSKRISFSFQLAAGIPAVESDASQMQQVFMNVALNAAEAIGDNTGVISISTGETRIESAGQPDGWNLAPGSYAFLEVRDTGCGMDTATRARIFDPFFTTKFQGRGLGLAAVAGIVRAQNGAIQVTSAPGAGSAFRILLPAMPAAHPQKTTPPAAAADLRGQGTVLVVDDEPVVRDLAKRTLERHG